MLQVLKKHYIALLKIVAAVWFFVNFALTSIYSNLDLEFLTNYSYFLIPPALFFLFSGISSLIFRSATTYNTNKKIALSNIILFPIIGIWMLWGGTMVVIQGAVIAVIYFVITMLAASATTRNISLTIFFILNLFVTLAILQTVLAWNTKLAKEGEVYAVSEDLYNLYSDAPFGESEEQFIDAQSKIVTTALNNVNNRILDDALSISQISLHDVNRYSLKSIENNRGDYHVNRLFLNSSFLKLFSGCSENVNFHTVDGKLFTNRNYVASPGFSYHITNVFIDSVLSYKINQKTLRNFNYQKPVFTGKEDLPPITYKDGTYTVCGNSFSPGNESESENELFMVYGLDDYIENACRKRTSSCVYDLFEYKYPSGSSRG